MNEKILNSQIIKNDMRYYFHVYDSELRINSQKKSEYQTANYLYCCMKPPFTLDNALQ